MNIKTIIQKAFYESKWYCAYRFLSDEELEEPIIPKPEEIRDYHVIRIPKRYWIADPFVVGENADVHLFFEYMDCYKAKASLGEMSLGHDTRKPNIIFEFPGHTSYPCIIRYNNKIYMFPETAYDHTLKLLMCERWPDKWVLIGNLLDDMRVADSTPFLYEGTWYIFIYEVNKNAKDHYLYLGELDLQKHEINNLHKVMYYNNNMGRPGGHVIYDQCTSSYIRVVQPGVHRYGERLEFYRFKIVNGCYEETKIGEFLPNQVNLDINISPEGVHTINRYGRYEVIDIISPKQLHLLRPIKLLLQFLKIGPFDLCDKRKKYMNGKGPAHIWDE